jgi:hypothetical protein
MRLTRKLIVVLIGAFYVITAYAQTGEAMPGEIIVKFMTDSETGLAITRALDEPNFDVGQLQDTADELADRCGLPLKAKRLTSGAEVLIELDLASLMERLQIGLSMRPDVESVSLENLPGNSPLHPKVTLLVNLAPESRSAALLERARSTETTALAELVCGLTGDAEVPVLGTPMTANTLGLIANVEALLEQLLSCLHRHTDIEYAQPNPILRIPGRVQ